LQVVFISDQAVYLGAVFFNLIAAAEPSANACVAHGTLCNDPTL